MNSQSPPRFLVDHMVGRLLTWLRLLGYDTVFAGALDDPQIARLAQQDGRIVLTRDRELARRKNISSVLLASEHLDEQLAQLCREGYVALHARDPRCPLCNGLLAGLPKERAEGRVPPYVLATQERFYCCLSCRHIYWQGTHWESMMERLARLAPRAGDSPRCPSRS